MPVQTLKVITAIPAGTNVTGLVPYSLFDFMSEQIEVFVGIYQLKGMSAADLEADVYPGTNPSSGDLKFTRTLDIGETIVMSSMAPFLTARLTGQYEPISRRLEIFTWAEKNGARVPDTYQATLRLLLDGVVIMSYPSTNLRDALGVFKFESLPISIVKGRTYFAEVTLLMVPDGSSTVVNNTMIDL